MKFPKFENPVGSSKEKVEINGLKASKYKTSFLEKNFRITESDLKRMSAKEAEAWIIKATWILMTLKSRIFENPQPLQIAEDYFGITSYKDFIELSPEEFLGENGLYDKVRKKMREIDV